MPREIVLYEGKYRFYTGEPPYDNELFCDRYGKKSRNFSGDKAIRALFDYAIELRREIDKCTT